MTKNREVPIDKQTLKPENFWHFSLSFYSLSVVKATCLHLQDKHNADVNMILLCCWLDRQSILIGPELFNTLIQTSTYWQKEILQPVRTQRRVAQKQTPLYTALLEQELSLEKHEQEALLEVVNGEPNLPNLATQNDTHNLLRYCKALGVPQTFITALYTAELHTG